MKLIVIEGVRGVGKDTFAELLVSELSAEAIDVHLATEPTKELYGDRALLRTKMGHNDKETALLFFLDRVAHIDRLERSVPPDSLVLMVRYSLSSFVYQEPEDMILSMHRFVRKPDYTILLDSTYERWRRVNHLHKTSGGNADRAKLRQNDLSHPQKYEEYRQRYLRAVAYPELSKRYIVLEAFRDDDEMVSDVWKDILQISKYGEIRDE